MLCGTTSSTSCSVVCITACVHALRDVCCGAYVGSTTNIHYMQCYVLCIHTTMYRSTLHCMLCRTYAHQQDVCYVGYTMQCTTNSITNTLTHCVCGGVQCYVVLCGTAIHCIPSPRECMRGCRVPVTCGTTYNTLCMCTAECMHGVLHATSSTA